MSLVFVGLELRQSTAAARAQTRQGLADRNAEVIYAVAENPELARAWSLRWTVDSEVTGSMSATDSVQAGWAMFGMLRHVENVVLQVQEGVIDETVQNSYGFRYNANFETPQFKAYWPTIRHRFDERFVEAFELEYGLQ